MLFLYRVTVIKDGERVPVLKTFDYEKAVRKLVDVREKDRSVELWFPFWRP